MQIVAEPFGETLSVEALEVRAGRKRVLVRAFSWQHRPGGVAWLAGENGTGKSSLLRVIACCDRPAAGKVLWTATRRRLHYYSPAMRAPDDLIVDDWIEFVLSVQGDVPVCAAVDRLKPPLASGRRCFGALSTGEAKRLLLWGFLRPLEGPLIVDEPYEHLSREAKLALTATLRAVAARAVVIVATNQDVPFLDGDQLLILDGTEVQVGR